MSFFPFNLFSSVECPADIFEPLVYKKGTLFLPLTDTVDTTITNQTGLSATSEVRKKLFMQCMQ